MILGFVAYLASKAEALKGGLVDDPQRPASSLETVSENVIFPPGAGNLPTMKIGVVYRAPLSSVACPCTLEYRDGNFPGASRMEGGGRHCRARRDVGSEHRRECFAQSGTRELPHRSNQQPPAGPRGQLSFFSFPVR